MSTQTNINDLPARWWTIAKTEDEALQIARQTRERNAALGLDAQGNPKPAPVAS